MAIIDPEKKVTITEESMLSKCKNSPFIGKELYGSVRHTICNGNVVYSAPLTETRSRHEKNINP